MIRRRANALLTVIAVLAFFGLSSAALGNTCPNEERRAEQDAGSLPECRAYEVVSPVEKNGSDAYLGWRATADGNRVAYAAFATYADAVSGHSIQGYVSQRESDGWHTRNISPTGIGGLAFNGSYTSPDFSEDLTKAIQMTASSEGEPLTMNILLSEPGGATTWVTQPTVPVGEPMQKAYAGRSADASRIFFETAQPFSADETFGQTQVWEWHAGSVRLVSVLPDGSAPANGALVGNGSNGVTTSGFRGELTQPTAVSRDGSRVFFTTGASAEFPSQIYVRENGSFTTQLTLSQKAGSAGEAAPDGGVFQGASADGSKAFFTSADELTDDSTPGGGLYEYDLEDGSLHFLTADPAGAQWQGLVAISPAGDYVYFVAGGTFGSGEATSGAHNLYLAHAGAVRFIATLGEFDAQNWTPNLGFGGGRTAQTTPDGTRLVFQSLNDLTSFGTGGHQEVYLWDSAGETLTCVSCGPAGRTVAGDASILQDPIDPTTGFTPDFLTQASFPRSITDDGSIVAFETTDALDPLDVNGKEDVYEFAGGQTHLISSGRGNRPSEVVTMSPTGSNLYFSTHDPLVRRDGDGGAGDIYDARIGGGYFEPPPPAPCSDESCRGEAQPLSAAATPGSALYRGPGNRKKHRRHHRHHRRHHHKHHVKRSTHHNRGGAR